MSNTKPTDQAEQMRQAFRGLYDESVEAEVANRVLPGFVYGFSRKNFHILYPEVVLPPWPPES